MPHQLALNVVARIQSDAVESLKAALGSLREGRGGGGGFEFAALDTVHFARLVIFDASEDLDGEPLPPQLALLTNYDAPEDAHLRELATRCGAGLDEAFGACEGYPSERPASTQQRERFLRAHSVESAALYVNRQGRSVAQILAEERLRIEIDGYLDELADTSAPPADVHRRVVAFVNGRDDLRWALRPAELPSFGWRAREWLHRVGLALLVLLLSPLLLLSLPLFLVVLRYHERRDIPDTSAASAQSVRDFRDDEDFAPQNQIIAIGAFKSGLFRSVTSAAILGVTDYACRHIYNSGVLSGLNTIHFARWAYLDDRRRLFFSSNYDGSLESYMNDFIDKAAWGLNGIFTGGEGFPRTRFLFCGGITDEKAYKRFLPTRQVHSRVWYSAYPHLTTKNIENHAAIRRGLSQPMSEAETRRWLRRFGVGNELPESGWVARLLDRIPWEALCQACK